MRIAFLCAILLPISARALEPAAAKGDWPWWGGPTRDHRASAQRPPTSWGPTKNILWKTPVPGRGHSSPAIHNDRVFLTSANERTGEQAVVAFDRKNGKALWATTAASGPLPRKHPKNSHASATPACDGQHVYSVFLCSEGLIALALNLDGKIIWRKNLGAFNSEHGYGTSPVVYKDLLIVGGDSLANSFFVALDRRSGEQIWRIERRSTGVNGNYSTPLLAHVAGKDQVIVHGFGETIGYDPATGKVIWRCDGPSKVAGSTPACSDKLVFTSGGYPEKELLAIAADGSGEVKWRTNKGVTYVPSPLYHDGRLYVVNDQGIASCFDAETGKQIWQERIGGQFSSSPVLAGGYIYVVSEAGKMHVLKAGSTFGVVATSDLGDGGFATPAIVRDQVFLRTNSHLYCIGNKAE